MTGNPTRDITVALRERVLPSGSNRRGLVIGIEAYRDSRLDLRCARSDAKAIYKLMIDPECGMFPKQNVVLLLDTEATSQNVWRSLAGLRRSAGENDVVWVYYAGHAASEDSNVYWVTYDTDVDDLYATGLGNDQVSKVLTDIRARQLIVLLDCCHAAATSIQKNPTRSAPTGEDILAAYKGKGRITLSSSDGKQKSVELGDVGHGAFTYFLEKGLRGEADQDGDGVVSANELWEYLRGKVAEASQKVGNRQTPMLMGEMTHDLGLTLNPATLGHKRRIGQAIHELVGLGDDKLTTEEAEMCLTLLGRPPSNRQEKTVADELSNVAEGGLRVVTFKALVQTALRSRIKPESSAPGAAKAESVSVSEGVAATNSISETTAEHKCQAVSVAETPDAPETTDARQAVLLAMIGSVTPIAISAFGWFVAFLTSVFIVGFVMGIISLLGSLFGAEVPVWGPIKTVASIFGPFFSVFLAAFSIALGFWALRVFPSGKVRSAAGAGLGMLLVAITIPVLIRGHAGMIDHIFELDEFTASDWSWIWIPVIWPPILGAAIGGLVGFCIRYDPAKRREFDRDGFATFLPSDESKCR